MQLCKVRSELSWCATECDFKDMEKQSLHDAVDPDAVFTKGFAIINAMGIAQAATKPASDIPNGATRHGVIDAQVQVAKKNGFWEILCNGFKEEVEAAPLRFKRFSPIAHLFFSQVLERAKSD